jgi:hypothetical protein
MSLIFPYQPAYMVRPIPSLLGRSERPRPLLAVNVSGPQGTWGRDGLLDTGADDTVFPEFVAAVIGIDLTNAPIGTASGAAASPVPLRYGLVTLRIASSQERREWRAWVGFTSAPLIRPLLGFAGFLQFFDCLFRGAREEVELTINANYSGT